MRYGTVQCLNLMTTMMSKIAVPLCIPVGTIASCKAWIKDLESLTEVCWFSVVWCLKVGGTEEDTVCVVGTCRRDRKEYCGYSGYMQDRQKRIPYMKKLQPIKQEQMLSTHRNRDYHISAFCTAIPFLSIMCSNL
jgi:hypothetical protein